ncbi:MAG: hypothetical protein ACLQPI_15765, partial [Limisphaerales bacterium]
MKFDFESGACGDGGEKIRHILLAEFDSSAGVSPAAFGCQLQAGRLRYGPAQLRRALRGEGGIHAGQRDEFGQKFFRARHGRRMSQANALCHFLLDTGFLRALNQIILVTKVYKIQFLRHAIVTMLVFAW